MSKSISAKILTTMLQFWPKLSLEESEQKMQEALAAGEEQTPPPENILTRYEEKENGRIFYAVEGVSMRGTRRCYLFCDPRQEKHAACFL